MAKSYSFFFIETKSISPYLGSGFAEGVINPWSLSP